MTSMAGKPHARHRRCSNSRTRTTHVDDDRSYEFADATIVVRWSQLAQDNAFAVDPAINDPFPNGAAGP